MKIRRQKPRRIRGGDKPDIDNVTLTVRQEFIRRLNEAVLRMNPQDGPHYEADAQGKPYIKRNNSYSKSGFMLEIAGLAFLLSVGNAVIPLFHALS